MSAVYPNISLPTPGVDEWLDLFVAPMKSRWCLYWRINDGPPDDPDTVEFGFISAHRTESAANEKMRWLTGELASQDGVA